SPPSHSQSISSRQSDCNTAELTIPTPGAACISNSTWPNMIYQSDCIRGELPDCATVNAAPLAPYVIEPWGWKASEAPEAKSMLTDLPRAGSAGQPPRI